jgi:hypothetical protein
MAALRNCNFGVAMPGIGRGGTVGCSSDLRECELLIGLGGWGGCQWSDEILEVVCGIR